MCVRGGSLIDNKRRQFSVWDISSPVSCLRPSQQHPENFEGQTESPFSRQGASQVRLWRIFLGAAHVYIGTSRNCAGTLLNWTYFKHEKTLIHEMQTFCTSGMLSGISQQPSHVYSQNCAWTVSEFVFTNDAQMIWTYLTIDQSQKVTTLLLGHWYEIMAL